MVPKYPMSENKSGFTLLEIMIVVAIIGMLCAMALPAFLKSRTVSQMNACINNLRQLDSAKEQCAMECRWSNGTPVANGDASVNTYIKGLGGTTNTPTCPAGGQYTYMPIGTQPQCSVERHSLAGP
jgi:prepilin-type N-terminal cleavage/methylation domain-containing protein